MKALIRFSIASSFCFAVTVVASLNTRALAHYDGHLVVDRLPMSLTTACYSRGARLNFNGRDVLLELVSSSDDTLFPESVTQIGLFGPKAKAVHSVEMKTIKGGWLPKCQVTLR
jgi:hypothetical protein